MSPTTLTPSLFDLRDAGSVLDRPLTRPLTRPDPLAEPVAGPSLDDVIVAAWEELATGSPTPCPVCHGELKAVWAHGPRPVGGRCQDCGTRLS